MGDKNDNYESSRVTWYGEGGTETWTVFKRKLEGLLGAKGCICAITDPRPVGIGLLNAALLSNLQDRQDRWDDDDRRAYGHIVLATSSCVEAQTVLGGLVAGELGRRSSASDWARRASG